MRYLQDVTVVLTNEVGNKHNYNRLFQRICLYFCSNWHLCALKFALCVRTCFSLLWICVCVSVCLWVYIPMCICPCRPVCKLHSLFAPCKWFVLFYQRRIMGQSPHRLVAVSVVAEVGGGVEGESGRRGLGQGLGTEARFERTCEKIGKGKSPLLAGPISVIVRPFVRLVMYLCTR